MIRIIALWMMIFIGLAGLNIEGSLSFKNHFYYFKDFNEKAIRKIIQDSNGFIWVASASGLFRFDGYTFFQYAPRDVDPKDLIALYDLMEDGRGNIWTGPYYGTPHTIDLKTEEGKGALLRFPDKITNVRGICRDEGGNLYFGTWGNGLFKYDVITKVFSQYKNQKSELLSLSDNYITSLLLLDGILWIGTEKGLNKFSLSKEKFLPVNWTGDGEKYLKNGNIRSFSLDSGKNLWIGTGNGLFKANLTTGGITVFRPDSSNPYSISHSFINCIQEDSNGLIWIGTETGGLNVFDPYFKTFINYKNSSIINQFLGKGSKVFSLFCDDSGRIWLGTQKGGLFVHDLSYNQFLHLTFNSENPMQGQNMVWSVLKRGDQIYVGTDQGLLRVSPDFKKKEEFLLPDHQKIRSTYQNELRSIADDRRGNIWLGYWSDGLYKFNIKGEKFENISHIFEDKKVRIFNIFFDKSANLWIGTYGDGLYKLEPESGILRQFLNRKDPGVRFTHGSITSIYQDSSDRIWAGTYGDGLYRFNTELDRFVPACRDFHSNSDKKPVVITLKEDKSRNCLWVGTYGHGIRQFDLKTLKYTPLPVVFSEEVKTIYSIGVDSLKRVWLASEKGLLQYHPEDGKLLKYDSWDGISITDYNMNAICEGSDGRFYFGGDRGLTIFDPMNILTNSQIAPIRITAYKRYHEDQVLNTPFLSKKSLLLKYSDSFSFEFSALNFSNTTKNLYAYQIKELHNQWIPLGTKREIFFNNMKPGNYTLRIKGSNNDQVWNEDGVSINLVITPPFWQTIWFKIGIFSLILILIITWHKRRIQGIARMFKTQAARETFYNKHKMSETQREVIPLIIKGLNNKQIEDKLFISLGTVRNNVSAIYKKLNISNRIQLVNIFQDIDLKANDHQADNKTVKKITPEI